MPHTIRPRAFIIASILISILIFCPLNSAMSINLDRFSISLSGDWANFDKMKSIAGTSYLWEPAAPINSPQPISQAYRERISGGPGFAVDLRYRINDRFNFGIGTLVLVPKHIDYVVASKLFLDDYFPVTNPFRQAMKARSIAPVFAMRYILPLDKISLHFDAGLAWIFGHAQIELPIPGSDTLPIFINERSYDFNSNGIGYILSAGSSHKISNTLYFSTNFGYRFLKTNELKDKNGLKWNDMRLDFSGPVVGIGLEIKL
jgi:hypothetical protein